MPQLNADGTVQVAPPTQSAFAPPPGVPQPAPPPQAAPAQIASSSPNPGFAGAILSLLQAMLGHAGADGSGAGGRAREAKTMQGVEDAQTGGNAPLGQQF
jgi:hypothetical protein